MNREERRAANRKSGRQLGRALKGPYRNAEGVTNEDALAALVDVLGAPPVRGELYRVGVRQGPEGKQVQFIGEYVGLARDTMAGEIGGELALGFALRNPALPVDAPHGTTENPWMLWPLDIWHLSPAEPGDLDKPMSYRVEGETLPPGPPQRQ